MKHLLPALLVVLVAGTASAQMESVHSSVAGAAKPGTSFFHHAAARTIAKTGVAPLSRPTGQEIDLTHFDNTKPTLQLALPVSISPYTMIALGERFTLPQPTGYVDSVTFVVDTAIGDSIIVGLAPDTLYEVAPGTSYHLMNIWTDSDFAETSVPVTVNEGRTVITVLFPHTRVPQNFWVYVAPNLNSLSFTSAFTIEGDRGPIVPRTADNTFSGFLAVVNGQSYSAILDSTFFDANNAMIYSNLNITAHVSVEPSGVSSNGKASAMSVYPNPLSDLLNVSGLSGTRSEFQIFDALGRSVMSGETDGRISTSMLAPGAYTLVCHDGTSIARSTFIVRH